VKREGKLSFSIFHIPLSIRSYALRSLKAKTNNIKANEKHFQD
jgi:hypothetical protein